MTGSVVSARRNVGRACALIRKRDRTQMIIEIASPRIKRDFRDGSATEAAYSCSTKRSKPSSI